MNLWADFDNHQPPSDVTGHNNTLRTRRLTERIVLTTLRDWLLRDYAVAYCRSLAATRIFRRCYWIDALGSNGKANSVAPPPATESLTTTKGRKKSTAQNIPLALQPIISLSQVLAQESKSIVLHGLIFDDNKSKTSKTRQSNTSTTTQTMAIPKESCMLHTNWLEAAPLLLPEIEQSPAIFLLNPFGPTMFSYDDLALLYQRTVPTELCLLLPHKQLEAHLLAARRIPAQASILTGMLRTDRWKTLPDGKQELAQAIDGLLELFMATMRRHFLLPVQHIALRMQVRPAAVEEIPYTLIFATRRLDSLTSMNDALCMQQRSVYEQSRQGILGAEWFAQQEKLQLNKKLQQLYQRALQQGRAQRARRWPDLRQQLIQNTFGQFTIHEYDTIAQQLLLNGEVRCEWRQRNLAAEEERIPGNEDTLLWR